MRDAETTLLIIEDRGDVGGLQAMPRRDPCRATDAETDGDHQIGSLESRILGNPVRPVVRPGKADVLSGSQSRRGKSRSPVAWMAGRRETECPEAHRHGHPRDGWRVPGP